MWNRSKKTLLCPEVDLKTPLFQAEAQISNHYGSINEAFDGKLVAEGQTTQLENLVKSENKLSTCSCSSLKALFFAASSSLCLGACSVLVKKMDNMDTGMLSMIRNLGTLVGSVPILVHDWTHPFGPSGKERYLLIIRCIVGGLAMYFLLLTYRLLPLSVAAIIFASLPAFVTIGAKIVLKEPVGIAQSIAVVICFCAVVLNVGLPEFLTKHSNSSLAPSPMGIAVAISTTLMFTFCLISIRVMKDTHCSVILVNMAAIGALENGILTTIFGYFSLPECTTWERWELLALGCFGFMGQGLMTLAAQSEAIGMVTIVKTSSDVLVSMLFQVIFFTSIPTLYNIIGAILVIICISIIGTRKWVLSMDPNSVMANRLHFLTI